MRLIVAHKILISAALALSVILVIRGVRLYAAGGGRAELLMALGFGAVGVILVLYLRHIWRK